MELEEVSKPHGNSSPEMRVTQDEPLRVVSKGSSLDLSGVATGRPHLKVSDGLVLSGFSQEITYSRQLP